MLPRVKCSCGYKGRFWLKHRETSLRWGHCPEDHLFLGVAVATAQDLIDRLQELIRQHGDLDVVDTNNEDVDVEFNQDDADPVFVIS
jgi:hypothetical protein